MTTLIGELPKLAFEIAEKPLKVGLSIEILYWLGELVIELNGKLKVVPLLQISATLVRAIVGSGFTITTTLVRVLSQVVELL